LRGTEEGFYRSVNLGLNGCAGSNGRYSKVKSGVEMNNQEFGGGIYV
jgi:hypothetical protein